MKEILVGVLIGLCLTFASVAVADTSVWKISKGDQYLFIGGTVHFLSPEEFPLPLEFEEAYAISDTLVFEVDMDSATSLSAQTKMMKQMTYGKGESLKSHISDETYTRLAEYASDREISMAALARYKPGMLTMMLSIAELQRLGKFGEGVDSFFNRRAIKEGKSRGNLESLSQQLSALEAMGDRDPDAFVNYTLDDMERFDRMMSELLDYWRRGDVAGMWNAQISRMKERAPEAYEALMVTRNKRWLPSIERLMQNSEIEFILVGVAHLSGDDSILTDLQKLGYTVESF